MTRTVARSVVATSDGEISVAKIIELNPEPSKKIPIPLIAGEMPDAVARAEKSLIAVNAEIYQRGGILVRPVRLPDIAGSTDAIRRAPGALTLVAVDTIWLQLELARCCEFLKFDARKDDYKIIDPPKEVAQSYLALAGDWRVRSLRGLIESPTIRADGSMLNVPGYDRASGLLADFDPDWPAIPPRPTRDDARAALKRLLRPVDEYAFATKADQAVWAAMVLTALVRPTLPAAPLFAMSASAAGSGKTEACNAAAIIATGRAAAAMSWGSAEEESEKRLGSMLLAGDAVLLIDNIERPLRGEMICSALTSESVKVRILGQSRSVSVPTSVLLMATGNNLTIAGDLNRRALVAIIDPGVERPELRRFGWTPSSRAHEEREKLVNAGLTIMRAYHVAGYPDAGDLPPFGSFEKWSERVRGALVWSGAADPVEVMERTREKDPEREQLAALLSAWVAAVGTDAITVRDVLRRTDARNYPNPPLEELREIIDSIRGHNDAARALGRYLSRYEGRIVDKRKFARDPRLDRDGVVLWKVIE